MSSWGTVSLVQLSKQQRDFCFILITLSQSCQNSFTSATLTVKRNIFLALQRTTKHEPTTSDLRTEGSPPAPRCVRVWLCTFIAQWAQRVVRKALPTECRLPVRPLCRTMVPSSVFPRRPRADPNTTTTTTTPRCRPPPPSGPRGEGATAGLVATTMGLGGGREGVVWNESLLKAGGPQGC
jgi:hypothetical protein